MVPPTWSEPRRVAEHPTVDHGEDWYAHWGLTHFLLDGHHKLQAAAETGRPLRLLSLLSVEGSLATPDQVAAAPDLRARPAAG
jgi:hypothetical protein